MKKLIGGIIVLLVLLGIGFAYRTAIQHPYQKITCPLDAEVCPDGTSVSRTGPSCTFPACPPPNTTLPSANIAFAIPTGFTLGSSQDPSVLAVYDASQASSTMTAQIVIRRYAVPASTTPLAVIQQTAIDPTTGQPAGVTSYSSNVYGTHRYTIVSLERANGIIDTAYYLSRGTDVLRFDAIDRGVSDWANPNLSISSLPAQTGLTYLLSTLEGQ